MLRVSDDGRFETLAGAREALRRVFTRFVPDTPSGDGTVAELMDEFQNFALGEGEWHELIKAARFDTAAKLRKMYTEGMQEPAPHELVKAAIHRATVSTEPRKFWLDSPASPIFVRVMTRLHSVEPASTGTERMNKFVKTIMTPSRSSLRADRVVTAVFIYANLRFLNNVASIDEKLIDFLSGNPTVEMSIEEIAKLEEDGAILYIDEEPILPTAGDGLVSIDII